MLNTQAGGNQLDRPLKGFFGSKGAESVGIPEFSIELAGTDYLFDDRSGLDNFKLCFKE